MKSDRSHLEGIGLGIGLGITAFMFINLALGRPLVGGIRREHEPIVPTVIDNSPEGVFASNCAACHQATGLGLPGQFPPLLGSSWVDQDPETPIRVVLMGIHGPIEVNGATFNGSMPPQSQLSDTQVAAAVTYIRTHFNEAEPVDEALVASVRASLSGRTEQWNGGAELQAMRGQ